MQNARSPRERGQQPIEQVAIGGGQRSSAQLRDLAPLLVDQPAKIRDFVGEDAKFGGDGFSPVMGPTPSIRRSDTPSSKTRQNAAKGPAVRGGPSYPSDPPPGFK